MLLFDGVGVFLVLKQELLESLLLGLFCCGFGLVLRYSFLTLTDDDKFDEVEDVDDEDDDCCCWQPGELGILFVIISGDDKADVSAALSPNGGGKLTGDGDASFGCISSGEPADPRDTGESKYFRNYRN